MKGLLGKLSGILGKVKKEVPLPPQAMQTALEYYQTGRFEEAIKTYRQILAHAPENFVALNNLGATYRALNRLDEAEAVIRQALVLNPDYAEAQNNLGIVFQKRGWLDRAESCFRRALLINPDYVEALTNLGNILQELGQSVAAVEYGKKAVELDPTNAILQWNLALLLLLVGDYRSGLALYEKRLECNTTGFTGGEAVFAKLKAQPRWQGGNLAGRRILVWAEQGFGDSLMVMRYLPLLRDKGAARLLVCCPLPLLRLMHELPGVDKVVSEITEITLDEFDLHCPVMSLPYLFDTCLETIPNKAPYLITLEPLNSKWRNRFANIRKLKVGIAWEGSRSLARRDIALNQFVPLFNIPQIQFVSLQKNRESGQLEAFDYDILNYMEECQDFMDTAALVDNLDLIISIDTAVAHLAGALGKPVWLLNRHESDWRWGLEREDSPWYPAMRIFRQPQPGDWDSVIQRVAWELESIATERSEN